MEIHGYADWDGTIIRQHTNARLHLLGAQYNKLRAPALAYWATRFGITREKEKILQKKCTKWQLCLGVFLFLQQMI